MAGLSKKMTLYLGGNKNEAAVCNLRRTGPGFTTNSFYVLSGASSKGATMLLKIKCHTGVFSSDTATVTCPSGGSVELVVSRGGWNRKVIIKDKRTGNVVAKARHPFTGLEFLTGADKYELVIAPGFDVAAAVLIAVTMDAFRGR